MRFLIRPSASSSTSHEAHTNLPWRNSASLLAPHTAKAPARSTERLSQQEISLVEQKKRRLELTFIERLRRETDGSPFIIVDESGMVANDLNLVGRDVPSNKLEQDRSRKLCQCVAWSCENGGMVDSVGSVR